MLEFSVRACVRACRGDGAVVNGSNNWSYQGQAKLLIKGGERSEAHVEATSQYEARARAEERRGRGGEE